MKNPMPIVAMVVLALVIVIGLIAFQASMMGAYDESNQTAEGVTLVAYETSYGWFVAMGLLGLILAIGFAFWYFWR
jgi:amino acid transporter